MKAFEEACDRSKERCAVRKEASSSHLSRLSQSRKSLPQPQEIEIEIETTIEITIKQQETPGTADIRRWIRIMSSTFPFPFLI